MKSLYLRSCLTLSALAVPAAAFSLYDTAPAVGLPESQAAAYFLSARMGYDTNPRGATDKRYRKHGEYVTVSVSTDFADVESVDKLSYNIRLGGTRYFGQSPSSNERYYGDCAATVSFVHAFSSQSRYNTSLNVTYRPEPSYADGMSNTAYTGDTLSWNWGNTYSQAIDTRWSWNVGLAYAGTKYQSSSINYDDRQYLTPSVGLRYRESDLMTYKLDLSEREEWRKEGSDSHSYFATAGFDRSLDPVSSFSLDAGVQVKYMGGNKTVSPTGNLGYRRRVTDGLSINLFAAYTDENASSYNTSWQSSYRSTPTTRVGITTTYALSPDVTFGLTLQYRYAQYKKAPRAGMHEYNTTSFNPDVWMEYKYTQTLSQRVGCAFTRYDSDYGYSYSSTYDRWKIYTGLTYKF